MLLVAVLGYFKEAGWRYLILITPLLFLAIVWAALYPWIHRNYLLQSAKKFFNESSYEKAFGTCTLSLSEARIASSSPIGEGHYLWSAVSRVSLTPDYLFIFLAGPQGFTIPRAQVPEATIQEMKALADEMSRRMEPPVAPNDSSSAKVTGSQAGAGPPSLS
jgi:hypothetical protein